MGFFSRLRKGLEKTKGSLIKNIETVVRGYAKIDEDMYDDLEAVMLTGDIGVERRNIFSTRSATVSRAGKSRMAMMSFPIWKNVS